MCIYLSDFDILLKPIISFDPFVGVQDSENFFRYCCFLFWGGLRPLLIVADAMSVPYIVNTQHDRADATG